MDIRPCSATDLDVLRGAWPSADDVHGSHAAQQDRGYATYLVAWTQEQPLGSALIQWRGPIGEQARAAFPGCVEVNHLQVRPEVRGSGVGTALITAAEQLATARGIELVALGVGVDNDRAARLYERLGYRRTGVIDVCEYDWTDHDGQRHHEIETDDLLIKPL